MSYCTVSTEKMPELLFIINRLGATTQHYEIWRQPMRLLRSYYAVCRSRKPPQRLFGYYVGFAGATTTHRAVYAITTQSNWLLRVLHTDYEIT